MHQNLVVLELIINETIAELGTNLIEIQNVFVCSVFAFVYRVKNRRHL